MEKPTQAPRKRRGVTLRNAADARRLLNRITNQLLNGEITEAKYKALSYGLTVFLRAAEQAAVENELAEIKKMLEEEL